MAVEKVHSGSQTAKSALKAVVAEVKEAMAKNAMLWKASRELKKMKLPKEELIGARSVLMELDYASAKSEAKWWRSASCLNRMREGILEELAVERDFGESGPLMDGAKIALDVVEKIVAAAEGAKKAGPDLRTRLLPA